MEEEYVTNKKYDVGEMVKIKSVKYIKEHLENCIPYREEMEEMSDKEYTIKEIDNVYEGRPLYRIEEWWFEDNWLEKINEKEEEKIIDKEIKLQYEATDEDIQEMIDKVDIETFKKIIQARVTYQECSTYRVTKEMVMKYLKKWAKAKFRFYKLLGGKLTTNKIQVEVEKDEQYVRTQLKEIIAEFPLYEYVIQNIYTGDIINNKLTGNSASYFLKDSRVKKGMKITKLIALYKNEDLNMAFSKIYQEKPIKDLYISIDPCDYLTVSLNKSGWRSCHNFIDGEWRNAGLALLQDNTSMVAYSANGKVKYDIKNEKFKWNSKNWRQMIYISETNSQLMFSLQYPYTSKALSDKVRSIIEEKLSKHLKIENKWMIKNTNDNIKVIASHCMYNDIGRYGCKYVIHKYDINKQCCINTGLEEIETLTDEDDYIVNGDDCLWD